MRLTSLPRDRALSRNIESRAAKRFQNRLLLHVSGDTCVSADEELIVRNHCQARWAVTNMGDGLSIGPSGTGQVINPLVNPAAVIAWHANEATTADGQVRPRGKRETFIKAVNVPVHLPRPGKTIEFDANGLCTAGC